MTNQSVLASDLATALFAAGVRGLEHHELEELAAHVYNDLELAVGQELSAGLSDATMLEFERLCDADDEPGIMAWFAANRPDYREIATRHREILIDRVVSAAAVYFGGGAR